MPSISSANARKSLEPETRAVRQLLELRKFYAASLRWKESENSCGDFDRRSCVAQLEASNAELRRIDQQLQTDKRNLATEDLSLLHRVRVAEDLLRVRNREITRTAKRAVYDDYAVSIAARSAQS